MIDQEAYSTRSENLRRRMSKVPELYDGVKAATDDDSRKKALSKAYQQLVPDEARRELALDFSVEAQKPSDGGARAIAAGEKLPTGTKVAFVVRPVEERVRLPLPEGPRREGQRPLPRHAHRHEEPAARRRDAPPPDRRPARASS